MSSNANAAMHRATVMRTSFSWELSANNCRTRIPGSAAFMHSQRSGRFNSCLLILFLTSAFSPTSTRGEEQLASRPRPELGGLQPGDRSHRNDRLEGSRKARERKVRQGG